jgi:hypothetical protein
MNALRAAQIDGSIMDGRAEFKKVVLKAEVRSPQAPAARCWCSYSY